MMWPPLLSTAAIRLAPLSSPLHSRQAVCPASRWLLLASRHLPSTLCPHRMTATKTDESGPWQIGHGSPLRGM
eukprot:7714337-Pyramimonas_sp.AAC.1